MLNTSTFKGGNLFSDALVQCLSLLHTALLNKGWTQVLSIVDGYTFFEVLEVLNLFRLLEKCEKDAKANKFGGTKACKTEDERKYFVNSKTENENFG